LSPAAEAAKAWAQLAHESLARRRHALQIVGARLAAAIDDAARDFTGDGVHGLFERIAKTGDPPIAPPGAVVSAF